MVISTKPEHELRVLDSKGDTRTSWNPEVEAEVELARSSFDTLRGKGYLAYRVETGGRRGTQLREFDPTAREIILAPPMQGG